MLNSARFVGCAHRMTDWIRVSNLLASFRNELKTQFNVHTENDKKEIEEKFIKCEEEIIEI